MQDKGHIVVQTSISKELEKQESVAKKDQSTLHSISQKERDEKFIEIKKLAWGEDFCNQCFGKNPTIKYIEKSSIAKFEEHISLYRYGFPSRLPNGWYLSIDEEDFSRSLLAYDSNRVTKDPVASEDIPKEYPDFGEHQAREKECREIILGVLLSQSSARKDISIQSSVDDAKKIEVRAGKPLCTKDEIKKAFDDFCHDLYSRKTPDGSMLSFSHLFEKLDRLKSIDDLVYEPLDSSHALSGSRLIEGDIHPLAHLSRWTQALDYADKKNIILQWREALYFDCEDMNSDFARQIQSEHSPAIILGHNEQRDIEERLLFDVIKEIGSRWSDVDITDYMLMHNRMENIVKNSGYDTTGAPGADSAELFIVRYMSELLQRNGQSPILHRAHKLRPYWECMLEQSQSFKALACSLNGLNAFRSTPYPLPVICSLLKATKYVRLEAKGLDIPKDQMGKIIKDLLASALQNASKMQEEIGAKNLFRLVKEVLLYFFLEEKYEQKIKEVLGEVSLYDGQNFYTHVHKVEGQWSVDYPSSLKERVISSQFCRSAGVPILGKKGDELNISAFMLKFPVFMLTMLEKGHLDFGDQRFNGQFVSLVSTFDLMSKKDEDYTLEIISKKIKTIIGKQEGSRSIIALGLQAAQYMSTPSSYDALNDFLDFCQSMDESKASDPMQSTIDWITKHWKDHFESSDLLTIQGLVEAKLEPNEKNLIQAGLSCSQDFLDAIYSVAATLKKNGNGENIFEPMKEMLPSLQGVYGVLGDHAASSFHALRLMLGEDTDIRHFSSFMQCLTENQGAISLMSFFISMCDRKEEAEKDSITWMQLEHFVSEALNLSQLDEKKNRQYFTKDLLSFMADFVISCPASQAQEAARAFQVLVESQIHLSFVKAPCLDLMKNLIKQQGLKGSEDGFNRIECFKETVGILSGIAEILQKKYPEEGAGILRSLVSNFSHENPNDMQLFSSILKSNQGWILLKVLAEHKQNRGAKENDKMAEWIASWVNENGLTLDQITLDRIESAYQGLPPYPDLMALKAWVEDKDHDLQETILSFQNRPFDRPMEGDEPKYGFHLDEFEKNRTLSEWKNASEVSKNGIFDQEIAGMPYGQYVSDKLKAYRSLATKDLCDLLPGKKDHEKEEPRQTKIDRLLLAVEFLARSASQKDPYARENIIGQELNTVQIMSLLLSIEANDRLINQIDTGEGKSRITMVWSAYQAMMGQSVDYVTSSNDLALRAYFSYRNYFKMMGCRSGFVYAHDMDEKFYFSKGKGGVNFSDVDTLMLLKNRAMLEQSEQFSADGLMADEVDWLIHHRSDTSYNLSVPREETRCLTWVYEPLLNFIEKGQWQHASDLTDDIIQEGIQSVCRQASDEDSAAYFRSFLDENPLQMQTWMVSAIKAQHMYAHEERITWQKSLNKKEVTDGHGVPYDSHFIEVISLGRKVPGAMLGKGVTQFLTLLAKRDDQGRWVMPPEQENQNTLYARNLIDAYPVVFGVTGTSRQRLQTKDSRWEMIKTPRNKINRLRGLYPWVGLDQNTQHQHIITEIKEYGDFKGQPILIGCEDDVEAQKVVESLKDAGLGDRLGWIDNDTSDEAFAQKVEEAGTLGKITIATTRAGRGTDIMASNLKVILTHMPNRDEARQLKGRAARFGQDGAYRYILRKDQYPDVFASSMKDVAYDIRSFERKQSLEGLIQKTLSDIYARGLYQIEDKLIGHEKDHHRAEQSMRQKLPDDIGFLKEPFISEINKGTVVIKKRVDALLAEENSPEYKAKRFHAKTNRGVRNLWRVLKGKEKKKLKEKYAKTPAKLDKIQREMHGVISKISTSYINDLIEDSLTKSCVDFLGVQDQQAYRASLQESLSPAISTFEQAMAEHAGWKAGSLAIDDKDQNLEYGHLWKPNRSQDYINDVKLLVIDHETGRFLKQHGKALGARENVRHQITVYLKKYPLDMTKESSLTRSIQQMRSYFDAHVHLKAKVISIIGERLEKKYKEKVPEKPAKVLDGIKKRYDIAYPEMRLTCLQSIRGLDEIGTDREKKNQKRHAKIKMNRDFKTVFGNIDSNMKDEISDLVDGLVDGLQEVSNRLENELKQDAHKIWIADRFHPSHLGQNIFYLDEQERVKAYFHGARVASEIPEVLQVKDQERGRMMAHASYGVISLLSSIMCLTLSVGLYTSMPALSGLASGGFSESTMAGIMLGLSIMLACVAVLGGHFSHRHGQKVQKAKSIIRSGGVTVVKAEEPKKSSCLQQKKQNWSLHQVHDAKQFDADALTASLKGKGQRKS